MLLIKGLIILVIGLVLLRYLIIKGDELYNSNPVALFSLYILDIVCLAFSGIGITAFFVSR